MMTRQIYGKYIAVSRHTIAVSYIHKNFVFYVGYWYVILNDDRTKIRKIYSCQLNIIATSDIHKNIVFYVGYWYVILNDVRKKIWKIYSCQLNIL